MGTRMNVYVGPEKDGATCAILYSNNSHEEVDAEVLVRTIAGMSHDANSFVRKCIALTYHSDGGKHKVGEPIFSFDTNPYDFEYVLYVYTESCDLQVPIRVEKRLTPLPRHRDSGSDMTEHDVFDWETIYQSGECPDCQELIPVDTPDGGDCRGCGHVFWQNAENDMDKPEQAG